MHKRKWMIAIAVTLLAVFLSPLSGDRLSVVPEASAQDKVKWRGVAAHRVGAHYNLWRWLEKRLPEITDGEVSLEATPPPLDLVPQAEHQGPWRTRRPPPCRHARC